MHFMNPVPLMTLVELAKGQHTSQQTFEACKGLAEFLGKDVATSQDRPVRRRSEAACSRAGQARARASSQQQDTAAVVPLPAARCVTATAAGPAH